MAYIIVSYYPLLRCFPGVITGPQDNDPFESLSSFLESFPSGSAEACLWATDDDNKPFPVLVLNRGREIADHFFEWSEDEPELWFKIGIGRMHGSYGLALMPNFSKSLDRHVAGLAIASGMAVPMPHDATILFSPIHFISDGPSETFASISIPPKMEVGILDSTDVPDSGLMDTDPDKIISIGSFEVDLEESDYVMSLLKEKNMYMA